MGAEIPDADHVAHYCSPSRVEGGLPASHAFVPPDGQDLSGNWLEYFSAAQDKASRLQQVRLVLHAKIKVKQNGRLVTLNVGAAKQAVRMALRGQGGLRVEHQPEPEDPSHVGIGLIAELGRPQALERMSAALRSLVRPHDVHPAA